VLSVGFDVISLFKRHPIIRVISGLKLISEAYDAASSYYNEDYVVTNSYHNPDTHKITFPTNNPGVTAVVDTDDEWANPVFVTPRERLSFDPWDIYRVNGISPGDENGLAQLDARLMEDHLACTDEVLDSGEGNHIRMLEMRWSCLQRKGHAPVNIQYFKVKHERYDV
jgi:hypothetical protein